MGFVEVLTLILITLKLVGLLPTFTWFMVFLPLIGIYSVIVLLLILWVIIK